MTLRGPACLSSLARRFFSRLGAPVRWRLSYRGFAPLWTDPAEYPAQSNLSLPKEKARMLAETPTRLAAMPDELQERLINFGYGMAERAIRSFFDTRAVAAVG